MAYLSYNGPENKGNGNGFVLFLAAALVVMMIMQYFAPPRQPGDQTTAKQESTESAPASAAEAPALVHEIASRTLESDQISVELTNLGGGRVLSLNVKEPDRYAEHGDFIRSQKPQKSDVAGNLPLEVTLPAFGIQPETQFAVVSSADDHKQAAFSYKDATGQYELNKSFTLSEIPYVVHASFVLTNRSASAVTDTMTVAMYIKQIKEEEPGIFKPGSFVAAKCYADGDMEYLDATDKNEKESYRKGIKWFGVDESYYAMAMTGEYAGSCNISNVEGLLRSDIQIPVSLEPGKSATYEFDMYLGPKESEYLTAFGEDRHLESIIDYGWMEVLARPMAWILSLFHKLTGNWGLAIILLTLIVRILLWPIAQKSQVSMMRMSKLAPLMQEIQEKYKNDPQTLAQKQMEMYQKHKISPLGCLPLLLQMPIFFALYRCIFVTGGLYHAEFYGWIHDLSARDPYFILPILSVALIVLQQLIMPSAAKNKQQKIMMFAMPIMFGAMMLFLPSGLCLYMVVSSVFSMGQSFYVRKMIAAEEAANPISAATVDGNVIDVEVLSSKDRRAAKRRAKKK